MVVRGEDGVVRGFFNVCRHRGTRICREDSGRFQDSIQCPYHAWTYALDGRLVGYLVGAPRDDSIWGDNVWVEAAGHAVEEAEDARDLYAAMVTDWRVTNLLASRFWPKRGFRPAFFRLYRSIP